MRNTSFLDFQYKLSNSGILRKRSRLLSSSNRTNSGSLSFFQPNLDEMRMVFDKFDANRDDKISRQEYKVILRALGKQSTAGELDKIFEIADLDRDGFIDFSEFMEVYNKGGGLKMADIQSAFRRFDVNNDGKISAEEVWGMLERLGESCSLKDCRKMVRAVDTDADGVIDMNEFMTMMTRTLKLS